MQTKEFQSLLQELYQEPIEKRPEFVREVILDKVELTKRDINIPNDLVIQRSAFKDQRPTLFCVTNKLPEGCHWDKVTATFDSSGAEPTTA